MSLLFSGSGAWWGYFTFSVGVTQTALSAGVLSVLFTVVTATLAASGCPVERLGMDENWVDVSNLVRERVSKEVVESQGQCRSCWSFPLTFVKRS